MNWLWAAVGGWGRLGASDKSPRNHAEWKERQKIWYPANIPTLEKFGSSSYGDFEFSKVAGHLEEPEAQTRAGSNPGRGISAPTYRSGEKKHIFSRFPKSPEMVGNDR